MALLAALQGSCDNLLGLEVIFQKERRAVPSILVRPPKLTQGSHGQKNLKHDAAAHPPQKELSSRSRK